MAAKTPARATGSPHASPDPDAPTGANGPRGGVEAHGIDVIPDGERHGRPGNSSESGPRPTSATSAWSSAGR